MKIFNKAVALNANRYLNCEYPIWSIGGVLLKYADSNDATPNHIYIISSERIVRGDVFMKTGDSDSQDFTFASIHICTDIVQLPNGREIIHTKNTAFEGYNPNGFDPCFSKVIISTDPLLLKHDVSLITDELFITNFIDNNKTVVNVKVDSNNGKIFLLKPHCFPVGTEVFSSVLNMKVKVISKFGTLNKGETHIPCLDDGNNVRVCALSTITFIERKITAKNIENDFSYERKNLDSISPKKSVNLSKFRDQIVDEIVDVPVVELPKKLSEVITPKNSKFEHFDENEFRRYISRFSEDDRDRMHDILWNFADVVVK